MNYVSQPVSIFSTCQNIKCHYVFLLFKHITPIRQITLISFNVKGKDSSFYAKRFLAICNDFFELYMYPQEKPTKFSFNIT